MININKILIFFWLVGIFISPVFGQGFGSAVIKSLPNGAYVYVNGFYFGKTPFEPTMMLPGKYNLTLKYRGYDSLTTEINIESGCKFSQELF